MDLINPFLEKEYRLYEIIFLLLFDWRWTVLTVL